MLGTRALWHDGWHVVAQRAPMQGGNAADLPNDTWELYHAEDDRSEMHDLAAEHPDRVRELVSLWYVDAGKYDVLPLDNRSVPELVADMPVAPIREGGIYRYYPGTLDLPEFDAADVRGRSFKILAQVDIDDADAQGVIMAVGSRFGGHALFVQERELWYIDNFLGIPPEQQLVSPEELTTGAHVLGAEFQKEGHGERGEAVGTALLYVDDVSVAKGPWKTQPGHFSLCGEGLSIGRDSGDSVSKEYTPYFASPEVVSGRSRSASATTPTSTSNATSTKVSPATDLHLPRYGSSSGEPGSMWGTRVSTGRLGGK
jgi:arylsulfatase